ncbi:hypothetical protein DPMN_034778 [Dreissena polymorpha]|uniref:Uncharacterized protein n=1 Tax=Dreissena polymorpha TaxID=45954 RepID=A0A9D4RLA5_DREPO|nr:hypothetical protein DPMN_034778 [Dreissena polymorpha]
MRRTLCKVGVTGTGSSDVDGPTTVWEARSTGNGSEDADCNIQRTALTFHGQFT